MSLRVSVSPWAMIAGGLLFYLSDGRTLRLLLPAVLAHELGHLALAFLLGRRLLSFRIEISGLCLQYAGAAEPRQDAVIAAAGPVAGLLYALAVRRLGADGALSAGISLLLAMFNILPAEPLDGGHISCALFGAQRAKRISKLTSLAVLVIGLYCLFRGRGAALFLAGCFLLLADRPAADRVSSKARTDRRCV